MSDLQSPLPRLSPTVESAGEGLRDAARQGDEEAVRRILSAHFPANDNKTGSFCVDTSDEVSGNGALHMAAANGHVGCVQLLLDAGANVDAKNRAGNTPLHWAALTGHHAAVAALLERGAALAIINEFGQTALDQARAGGHQHIVDFLMKRAEECATDETIKSIDENKVEKVKGRAAKGD